MGRVGNDNIAPPGAFRVVVFAHDQHPHQLPLGTGRRLQSEPIHPGDGFQRLLQPVHQLQRSLGVIRALARVQPAETGPGRQCVVHLGIVLHGAAAQGIKVPVHMVVFDGKTDVMPQYFRLGNLGQLRGFIAQQVRRKQLGWVAGGHVAFRDQVAHPAGH